MLLMWNKGLGTKVSSPPDLPRLATASMAPSSLPSFPALVAAVRGAECSVLCLELESQSLVPPTRSSEEGEALEDEEEYKEEEEDMEDEALWAWPGESSSPDPGVLIPTERSSDSQASSPTRAALQPGASPPPSQEPESRPPRVLGPPQAILPTPRRGSLASPPPSTPAGAREGVQAGAPELSGLPRGEGEEVGSSEDGPSLLPTTWAPKGARDPEAPNEEKSGRTVPAGSSVQTPPVLPTDSGSRGGAAVAPSSGNFVQGSTSLSALLLLLPLKLWATGPEAL